LLDLKSGDALAVSIRRPNGQLIFHDLAKMGSGKKIYRSYVNKRLKEGEEIRVTVSHPPEEI
jgi:DNA helicase HerA-like ATPase